MKLPVRRAVHSEGFLWSGKEFPKQAIPEGICCFPEDNQKSLFARSPKMVLISWVGKSCFYLNPLARIFQVIKPLICYRIKTSILAMILLVIFFWLIPPYAMG